MSHPNPLFEILLWSFETAKGINSEIIKDYILHAPEYYKIWFLRLWHETPQHVLIETGLICFIIWLIFIRKTVDPSRTSKNVKLTKKEIDELLDTWQPEPLVPAMDKTSKEIAESMLIIESVHGNNVTIRGYDKPILNLSTFDFLGLGQSNELKTVAETNLDKYGCGSCGPRGFYGTIVPHLNFENEIARFMGAEEAIAYSDGASCVYSAIPAFAKKGDLLIIDEACSEPILTGAYLSRSTVQYFKHNDMKDLERILNSISKDDHKLRRDPTQQRRFIVAEGLYRNTGNICPLPELMALKERFFYRLILDESMSFGTLGKTGRGVTDLFNIPTNHIEILLLAMDTALASVGGVCIGSREVVDHQRLSGAGYCFSASAPPFLAACAVEALAIIEKTPSLLENLASNAEKLHKGLSSIKGWKLLSTVPSPVMHLVIDSPSISPAEEFDIVHAVAEECLLKGVGVAPSKFAVMNEHARSIGMKPSLRLSATAALSSAEIKKAVADISKIAIAALK